MAIIRHVGLKVTVCSIFSLRNQAVVNSIKCRYRCGAYKEPSKFHNHGSILEAWVGVLLG